MLKKWVLGNFKSVRDRVELDFKPVTVLSGINSSGKSTILQSVLMITQTFHATADSYPLVLNGDFLRLGHMNDILHAGAERNKIVIGFTLDLPQSPDELTARQSIQVEFSVNGRENVDINPYGYLTDLQLRWGQEHFQLRSITPKDKSLRHVEGPYIPPDVQSGLSAGKFDYVVTASSLRFRHLQPFQPQFSVHKFLPQYYLETYDHLGYLTKTALLGVVDFLRGQDDTATQDLLRSSDQDETSKKYIREQIIKVLNRSSKSGSFQYAGEKAKYVRFFRDFQTPILQGLETMRKQMPPVYRGKLSREIRQQIDRVPMRTKTVSFREVGVRQANIPPSLESIVIQINEYFDKLIYYLGPLREPPQYLYLLPPSPSTRYVGIKGEYAPTVLERYQGEHVEYPLPDYHADKKGGVDTGPLSYALRIWLEHMGLLEKVTTKDLGKAGTELTVRATGVNRDLDLTSVGVGVSQVLPLLVGCLLAPSGTTFLLEQPELHLHPKVQAILADFFIGLTRVGKQVIVETHSEYLINRLRRRVAEDETDTLADDIQIYFTEREDGQSLFRRVDMNAYGAVIEWPKGFFDEGPNEAQMIMEAAMRKRRKAKEKQRSQGGK